MDQVAQRPEDRRGGRQGEIGAARPSGEFAHDRPGLTGDEVMGVLRAVSPNVPFVMISGYLGSDPVREAAAMKATDFVQKPFLPDDLVDAVRRSLHQTPFQGTYEVDYGATDGGD